MKLKTGLTKNFNVSGRGPTTGTGTSYGNTISLNIDRHQFEQLKINVNTLSDAVKFVVAQTIVYIMRDLLTAALPRTPVDTGQLRESGTAAISFGGGYEITSRGSKSGTVTTNARAVTLERVGRKGVRNLYGSIYFNRPDSHGMGLNIALWTHEDLLPYEERSQMKSRTKKYSLSGSGIPEIQKGMQEEQKMYFARTPGTGPKYLELPFIERRGKYRSMLKDAVKRKLPSLIKSISKEVRSGKTSQIKLIRSQIAKYGYWGL